MAQVVININHREYAISCEDGEELHIMKLGRLLDDKAQSLTQALGQINENLLLAMVGLLVADELSETKKSAAAAAIAVEPQVVKLGVSEDEIASLDEEIAQNINSLSDVIKSVALKLKSV